MDDDQNNSNLHIADYIQHYLKIKEPHYAVMLTGEWGIGKTFLLKQILRTQKIKKNKYVLISLYGAASSSDIDTRIYTDTHTILTNNIIKYASSLLKSFLELLKFKTDLGRHILFSKFKRPLYIFDDLERCQLPIEQTLGYINEFVEHKGKHVIIIGNEKEIKKPESYLSTREKLIGKTLSVQPSTRRALENFNQQLRCTFFREQANINIDTILQIHASSEISSLRILQQSLWDIERVFEALEGAAKLNADFLKNLIDMLLPLSIALKAGEITPSNLMLRPAQAPSFLRNKSQDPAELSAFERLERKHPQIDLRDTILNNTLLASILGEGTLSTHALNEHLSTSHYFREPTTLDILNDPFGYEEPTVQAALSAFENDCRHKAPEIPEDILSRFDLKMRLCSIGLNNKNTSTLLDEEKAYLDTLFNSEQLPPLSDEHYTDRRHGIFNGHSFLPHEKKPEYEAFFEHYKRFDRTLAFQQEVAAAHNLLAEMESQPDLYIQKLICTDSNSSHYVPEGVLCKINAHEFANTLQTLPPAQQSQVLSAFNKRYGFTGRMTPCETQWLIEVIESLIGITQHASAFEQAKTKYQIENFIANHLPLSERHRSRTLLASQ